MRSDHLLSRRKILYAASAATLSRSHLLAVDGTEASIPIGLGVVVWVRHGDDPDHVIARVRQLGFPTCQIGFKNLSKSAATLLRKALDKHGVEATALLELGPGRMA